MYAVPLGNVVLNVNFACFFFLTLLCGCLVLPFKVLMLETSLLFDETPKGRLYFPQSFSCRLDFPVLHKGRSGLLL